MLVDYLFHVLFSVFLHFFILFSVCERKRCKNAEKEDVDQCTVCDATLRWTKYTTGKYPKMIPKPLKDPLKHTFIEKL